MKPKIFLYVLIAFLAVSVVFADYFNTTELEDATNLYDQSKALNTITSGLVGYGLVLISFVITFVVLQTNSSDAIGAMGGASFITVVFSIILLPLGFIPFWLFRDILVLCGAMIALSLLIKR